MPIHVALENGMITSVFSGTVTGEDLVQFGNELLTIERQQPTLLPRLTDLSAATAMDVSFRDISALADRRRDQQFPNPFKSAILAPTPVQFGIARMFQTLNTHPQIAIRVFQDRAAALAWLHSADTPPPRP